MAATLNARPFDVNWRARLRSLSAPTLLLHNNRASRRRARSRHFDRRRCRHRRPHHLRDRRRCFAHHDCSRGTRRCRRAPFVQFAAAAEGNAACLLIDTRARAPRSSRRSHLAHSARARAPRQDCESLRHRHRRCRRRRRRRHELRHARARRRDRLRVRELLAFAYFSASTTQSCATRAFARSTWPKHRTAAGWLQSPFLRPRDECARSLRVVASSSGASESRNFHVCARARVNFKRLNAARSRSARRHNCAERHRILDSAPMRQ